jgi:hydrogenase maturation protease
VRTLCIAIGNPLRGDDGVAHRVLDLLQPAAGVAILRAQQLVPELSEEIARARNVIFIDADINAGAPHIEQIVARELRGSPLAHAMTPAEVVCLAARLFGFDGAAFVCHVPGIDFDPGEGLSASAEANAHRATQIIGGLCTNLR